MKITLRVFLSILLLLVIALLLLQTEWGQNWLATQVTKKLSKDLRSRISISRVDIDFFNRMNLEGVMVEDQKQDTLLYAGKVQVRITDWFFFRDKADLKYIGLENAVIHLQRTDSVWNYHFLQQYFASSPSTGPKKKAGIAFNLQQVEMRNVSLVQSDKWLGRDMIVKLGSLDLDANKIDFSESIADIANIDLNKPFFHLYDYKGNRPDSLKPKKKNAPAATTDSLQWNVDNWLVKVASLNIRNGGFRNDKDSLVATTRYFDGMHIHFNAITGKIDNFTWTKDTIKANIKLSTKERSGLVVQTLQSNFRFHPKLMEFNHLLLRTNKSVLKDYFSMRYENIGSMNDFIHAVTMQGNFKNSSVHSDDIAFFAPEIRDWNKNIRLDGKVKGTVDALAGKDITLHAGNNTFVNGDVSLIGLPDINTTYIDLRANNLRTTYSELLSFIPSLRSVTTPNLRALSYFNFTGTYTGFINDFVTFGTLKTALGTLVTDLNMKFPASGEPVYSGHLSTNNFQLGQFINSPTLGILAFNGQLKGKSFQWKTLDLSVDGKIEKLQIDDYTYQNITANGKLKNRMFNGDFVINDPNANFHLSGLIDLSGKQPRFDAKADIAFANLKALQLAKENLVLKGKFDLNFTGQNLNDFLGYARINNASLLRDDQPLSFDSLIVSSQYINGEKVLRVGSNELEATIAGQIDVETLPDAFQLFLNRYYPSYIKPPRKRVNTQSFRFDIKTGIIEDYVKLLDNRLAGFNNSQISGSLDLASNSLTINASVPQASYQQYQFSEIKLTGNGNFDRLIVSGQVNDAIVSDSLRFPQTTFSIQARNDTSDIAINTTANQTINQADLSAQVQTFSNGFKVLLNPSSFVLNGKRWTLEEGGELDFRKNTVVSGQVVLRETNQEIILSTQPSEIGSWNDLLISVRNLNLGDLSPLLVKTNRIEGLLTGDIHIEDPQNRLNISGDLMTDQLRVDNDSIGQLKASLLYNNNTGLFTVNGSNLDEEKKIDFDVALDFKDSANAHTDRITIRPVNYPVKILERFIGDLFSDLQGYVTGKLDILGEGNNRDYIGKASLHNAGLKVNFTQVFYKIDDTEIELKKDGIYFGTMKLRDRFNNTATLNGYINHNSFSDMYYDIAVKVDSRQMELLNTSYNDNQQFYGRAMGTGNFFLVGPQNDMLMNIEVTASTTDSSYITIPPSRSRESGEAAFMVERKFGREMTGEDLDSRSTNMQYLVSLNANPMVNIDMILDELNGDIIKGRGRGNLRISSGTNEPLSIRGRYEIVEGNYLFTFQSFFKKPFVLQPGANNYIEWTGDPYDARIHFDAVYTAERVSFAPLSSSANRTSLFDQTFSNLRENVNVIATLTGELFKPTLAFRLELPSTSQVANNPNITFGLQQIERNPNELNKQVTYLIVFNSFAPYENLQAGNGFFNEFAYSTISGLLFGEVNKRLNQWLARILRNNDLTVNFTGSLYNRNIVSGTTNNFQINQSQFNLNLGRAFFDERFVVSFGSTVDIPIEATAQQTIQFLPDVTAQWLINESGSIRATFFYRQNLDYLTPGNTGNSSGLISTRAGANISYRREFDNLGKSRGKRKKQTSKQVSIDSVNTGQ